jgi:hypothetical protein
MYEIFLISISVAQGFVFPWYERQSWQNFTDSFETRETIT